MGKMVSELSERDLLTIMTEFPSNDWAFLARSLGIDPLKINKF